MNYDASFAPKLKAEINYINVHPISKMGEHLFKFMCDIQINVPKAKLHHRDRNQLFSYMDKI